MNQPIGLNEQIAATPLPVPAEVKRRSSLRVQSLRFAVLNLRILRLSRQHH